MALLFPITLSGNNLGERHRQLNSFVTDAFKSSIPFKSIQDVPESSPIDRLFKIDLASKYKDVDYIVQNLKDTDMLYVSRALKCTWLLDPQYSDIINPNYLENELFPEMTTTAINKMKHWIHDHLQDPERCRIFYECYKNSEFQLAMKFLRNCANEYVLEEFETIWTRITPKQLKVFSEKCPQLTKLFYERIKHDRDLLKHYLENEDSFLHNLKYLLKADPDTFFVILEQYYSIQRNRSFRSDITKHIMVHHTDKFCKKPELYTVHLLDMNTIAKCMSPEEAKDLILKLAHAAYLENWFRYKTVEPLILRLNKDERVLLKKMIFVNKELGDKIKDWPYELPTSPVLEKKPEYSLFSDKVQNPRDYFPRYDLHYKKAYKKNKACFRALGSARCRIKKKTLLEELFNHYRFASFENTFFELRTRLRSESSPQNRQFMMLVLVSKSGGRESTLRTLFGLLAQYKNEPVHWRAAIVRSLVKRAFAWRLPEDLWRNLMDWAYDLGLDGSEPKAACNEGLHAVVLRDLLSNKTPTPSVLSSFLNRFTNFTEYVLETSERCCVKTSLPNLLMAVADKETGDEKLRRFSQVLDTLQAYKVPLIQFPGIITAIGTAAQDDLESYEYILQRLFVARAGRKQLFKLNFIRKQNNASYVNALRHDVTVLNAKKFHDLHDVDKKINYRKSRFYFDHFLKKLIVYFSEHGGLAKEFYAVLKLEAERNPLKLLARPLAILAGSDLTSLLRTFDCDTVLERRPKTALQSISAALRANAHLSRPPIDFNEIAWEVAGVKAVANLVSISPKKKREIMVAKLTTWKRALRLGLAVTVDECTKYNIFASLVASRPGTALKVFLKYLNSWKTGEQFLAIWREVKPLITKLDFKNRQRLFKKLRKVSVPEIIKSEYYVLVFTIHLNVGETKALPLLCEIENICYNVDENFLYNTLSSFLENGFKTDLIVEEEYEFYDCIKFILYIRLLAKFLLLCGSEEEQKRRLEIVGEPFFSRFEHMWKDAANRKYLDKILFAFLTALKYNRVSFDNKYVSALPVLEKVVQWMQNILPTVEWFDGFVSIHLTILYHKAARYCIEQKSEYFKTDSSNLDSAVEMFGAVFGKLVAHEFEEMTSKYFPSVKEIYKKELMDYFVTNIDYDTYDASKEKFVISFIKSVLVESATEESHLIAFHVFREHVKTYFKYNCDLSEIINMFKETKNNELTFNYEIMMTDSVIYNKINRYLDTAMEIS